uniref:Uncharacterized protein n=1 Tax=Glyptapanteles indiensis TaxID=92994 RepID=A0JCX3_GLYIN|nr:hypothetical protein GIP_L1_00520 [Glyptapanteles indiensis]
MTFAKISIFLFCLIIGTSVFPNGSPTGLASAKPASRLEVFESKGNIEPDFGQNSGSNSDSFIIYGAVTNQKGAFFHNENIGGSVSYGSITSQNNNNFSQ